LLMPAMFRLCFAPFVLPGVNSRFGGYKPHPRTPTAFNSHRTPYRHAPQCSPRRWPLCCKRLHGPRGNASSPVDACSHEQVCFCQASEKFCWPCHAAPGTR
jgi:hypothetical protein